MNAPPVEILAPIRTAIIGASDIASKLASYQESRAVFTRRPTPSDAPYPMCVVGPIITRTDTDGINDWRPTFVLDVNFFGTQGAPGSSADHYRDVEAMAEAAYSLFHRQRSAITVAGWSVTQIRAAGPSPVPADDATRVGRGITLTIDLYAKG